MPKAARRSVKTKPHLLWILEKHVGRAMAVRANKIAKQLRCSRLRLEEEVAAWRTLGIAICGDRRTGYFMAETVDELREVCVHLRRQAINAIRLEAKLRLVPCVDVLEFIAQDLEMSGGYRIGIVRSAAMARARMGRIEAPIPAPVDRESREVRH